MSSNFRYQISIAASWNVGGRVLVVDEVVPTHEKEICAAPLLDKICIEFEIQTDQNYYADLRQTYLALKLKLLNGRGYDTYISKEVKKKSTKERLKWMWKRRRSNRLQFLSLPM